MVTKDNWETLFIDFQGESHAAAELCTWSLYYERVAGLLTLESLTNSDSLDAQQINNLICSLVSCSYIPRALQITGYILCGINYACKTNE